MITLKKFYFYPNIINNKPIDPIEFDNGLNIILGEKSGDVEKMNSVGKSLLIEMINYCLLSDARKRIVRIPTKILPNETLMCLDFEIENDKNIKNVTIKRVRDSTKPFTVKVNEKEQEYENIEDARRFLESLTINVGENTNTPTFRNLLSILIREEKSSFDDILRPYASKIFSDFNDLIKTHLFLFNFDISLINRMKQIQKELVGVTGTITNIKKSFKASGIDIKTIKSYINGLQDTVDKLNLSVHELKPGEGINQLSNELSEKENELDVLISQKSSKEGVIRKIKKLPKFQEIDIKKVEIIYNTFKEGLGGIVKKSLDEVKELNCRIEDFQNKIFSQKLQDLQYEVGELGQKISLLDNDISKIYRKMGADNKIESLKKSIKEAKEKDEELNSLSAQYSFYENKIEEEKNIEKQKTNILEKIEEDLVKNKQGITIFENSLKDLHKIITGNQICQFDIKILEGKKNYVDFDYRIDLDGGSGMDRIRTFMYDFLLMTSDITSNRHLGFLIHDNIFPSTGRDDMVKSLNYVSDEFRKGKNFQYIVTLNTDEFEAQKEKFNFNTIDVTKVKFTREEPFLKTPYREV